jgi:tetratricopeptide (TPR) repeat protein
MAVKDYVIADDNSLPRAVDHLHEALAADSTFTRAHFLLTKVYDQAQALGISQGPVQEPLTRANRFLERLPEWERQYARGWQLWLVEGDLEEAAAVLSQMSKEYPDYAWHEGLPLTLGRLLAHQGRWSQAIQQLKAYVAAEETPVLRKGLGWGQLATAYQITGNLGQTIEAIERELSLCSSRHGNRYWWIQENMALALLRFENSEQEVAEEILTRTQEFASGDARGLAMIALALFQMQQNKRAEDLARKALRLKEDLAAAHYVLGLISLKRKEHEQAVACFEAACSQEYHWDYLYHAGLAHGKRGDRQSADEILTFLVDVLQGDSPQAVEPMDLGMLGILMSRLGRYDQALTHGLEGAKELPYPRAKYDLACIYAIQGNQDNAMKWLRAAFSDGYIKQRQSRTDFDLEKLWYNPDFILLTSGD